jgi:hypothetical protein
MRDVNGMNIGVATDAALDGRAALLAIGMNGTPQQKPEPNGATGYHTVAVSVA